MVYAYVALKITDPAQLAAYREVAQGALAKHGGKVEGSAGEITVLDGAPDVPDAAVILSFPDKASAVGWANDPDLADIHALRRGAGTSEIVLLG